MPISPVLFDISPLFTFRPLEDSQNTEYSPPMQESITEKVTKVTKVSKVETSGGISRRQIQTGFPSASPGHLSKAEKQVQRL